MLRDVIKQRLKFYGVSQDKASKVGEITPTQMGLFLQEKGNLRIDSLERIMEVLGVDLKPYQKRGELILKTAEKLRGKDILKMSKEDMIKETGFKEIKYLSDYTIDDVIESDGMLDIESTFVFFKAIVASIPEQLKPKRVHDAFMAIIKKKAGDDYLMPEYFLASELLKEGEKYKNLISLAHVGIIYIASKEWD